MFDVSAFVFCVLAFILAICAIATGSDGEEYAVLVNGMGATPLMEQFVFMSDVKKLLVDEEKLTLSFRKVGDYMTAIDMEGLSLTLVKLEDDKWLDYLNAPVDVISW